MNKKDAIWNILQKEWLKSPSWKSYCEGKRKVPTALDVWLELKELHTATKDWKLYIRRRDKAKKKKVV